MKIFSAANCEDLRVDCTSLVQSRYCLTSQNFMKTYCARSCGFCFAPPATEIPDTTIALTTAATESGPVTLNVTTTTSKPTLLPPLATVWPILK